MTDKRETNDHEINRDEISGQETNKHEADKHETSGLQTNWHDDHDELTAKVPIDPPVITRGRISLLPGVIAIAFYMLALAAVVSFGVAGGRIPPIFLFVAALFVAASFGLLRLFRWAWALALAAAFGFMAWFFWIFYSTKESMGVIMGLLNLIFFLYLVRPDVRSRLR